MNDQDFTARHDDPQRPDFTRVEPWAQAYDRSTPGSGQWAGGSSTGADGAYVQYPYGEQHYGQQAYAQPSQNQSQPQGQQQYAQAYVTQPQPTAAREKQPRRAGAALVAAVALVAALVGGGVSAAAVTALHPAAAPGQTVTTTKVVQGQSSAPDWSVTASAAGPSVVSIQVMGSQGEAEGSGVVLDAQGNVATNNHVVASLGSNAQLQVTLADRQVYDATVVGTDAATDLAVIKLQNPPADLHPITIADSSGVKVGQPVMALGNPLGLSQTATTGIVSALNRPVITQQQSQGSRGIVNQAQQAVSNAIQTSAAINPGNSGGALLNADGQLIGITSSIATLGGSSNGAESGNIGIGFAIPSNEVRRVTGELMSGHKATHAYLGVSTSDGAGKVGDTELLGATVRTVSSGAPAAQAGIREGDVITAIDGEAVSSSESLMAQIRDHAVGAQVKVTVARDGKSQDLTVTLANQPS